MAITILRDLWRRRALVALFALVALALGTLVAYKPGFPPQSRATPLGEGHLQLLVDTPSSQVVEIDPEGSIALGARASLIANLMVGGEVKTAIAKAAKISPHQLIALSDSAVAPSSVTLAQIKSPNAYVLKTSVVTNDDGENLPIIAIDTQAPNGAAAAALADAAATGVGQYLDGRAVREGVPDGRRLKVRSLGTAQAHDVVRGPGKVLAIAAAILIFSALCGAMLLLMALARGWRAAEQRDGTRGSPTTKNSSSRRASRTPRRSCRSIRPPLPERRLRRPASAAAGPMRRAPAASPHRAADARHTAAGRHGWTERDRTHPPDPATAPHRGHSWRERARAHAPRRPARPERGRPLAGRP